MGGNIKMTLKII